MDPATHPPLAAPRMRRGDVFETAVDRLAFGGRGVGRAPDGRIAFVEDALPGDVVVAYYTRIKKDFVEARVESVVEPSTDRVEPACPHFGDCGGCRLQHLAYPAQAREKASQVREALCHIGGLRDVEVRGIVPADSPWFYRNKMEFAFSALADGTLLLGLHRRGRFDRIVDLSECRLLDERTGPLLDATRRWAVDNALPPYDVRRATGLLRYLVVRLGKATSETLVDLVTTSTEPPAGDAFVRAVRSVMPEATIVHTTHRGRATAYIVEAQEVLSGRGLIEERLDGWRFEISPESFFQTNSAMARRLCETAREAAALTGDEAVLDLYCGTGTLGITLSGDCARVVGLEQNDAAVADAERNASLNGAANCRFVAARAEESLRDVLARHGPFDVAVVDPPRAGLHPKALAALATSGVRRVAYVSCNPATLARDLAGLADAGLKCAWVRPVDMFPQTPHVEAVAALSRTAP